MCSRKDLKFISNNSKISEMAKGNSERKHMPCDACDDQKLKMVYQELGGHPLDFQALMKYGTESGWKGRLEAVLVLKKKAQELREHLKALENELPPSEETPHQEFVKENIPKERKMFWRLELERRMVRENAEKSMIPIAEECNQLRKDLDAEKSRFRELNEEVKLLRAQLQSQVEKNEEDFGIVDSFHVSIMINHIF
ncbi:uncharacterized protein LOC118202557 isoform X2 [Stegodyphus dumicola]|uniref:uncharacterized protein LOC118202557 isoform X2 n=1 Tax=Stegodyphus dumicola TaxID=202533 RepID=UPI0015AE5290|nr:uncharacterized protein LOC118202557 isoform X2 [Stegodyphus dumicola]